MIILRIMDNAMYPLDIWLHEKPLKWNKIIFGLIDFFWKKQKKIQIFIPAASESIYSGHNADDTFIFKPFQIQSRFRFANILMGPLFPGHRGSPSRE